MAYSVLEIAKIIDPKAFEALPIGEDAWRVKARVACRKRALEKAARIADLVAGGSNAARAAPVGGST